MGFDFDFDYLILCFLFCFCFISVLGFILFKKYIYFYKLFLIKFKGHFKQFKFQTVTGGYTSVIFANYRPIFGIFQNSRYLFKLRQTRGYQNVIMPK